MAVDAVTRMSQNLQTFVYRNPPAAIMQPAWPGFILFSLPQRVRHVKYRKSKQLSDYLYGSIYIPSNLSLKHLDIGETLFTAKLRAKFDIKLLFIDIS